VVGLGTASSVKKIEVVWPSGITQVIAGPPLDRYIVINEKAGS
jgi:hypothetical protein